MEHDYSTYEVHFEDCLYFPSDYLIRDVAVLWFGEEISIDGLPHLKSNYIFMSHALKSLYQIINFF